MPVKPELCVGSFWFPSLAGLMRNRWHSELDSNAVRETWAVPELLASVSTIEPERPMDEQQREPPVSRTSMTSDEQLRYCIGDHMGDSWSASVWPLRGALSPECPLPSF